ncbi:TonB-dependent receptor [Reichenbachiella carrageenanivorans]|uniref:TonB-dependent receptor n=1 Tax=Reichenbachiella carrageenanivorans TaxID=2979869 RepID=A0ABY6D1W2_9BACT|nr:TonB-dependent receptor [Reichenbachiella carrageenanivorans]UXX79729.1 TonB-dependent receptor [Reichenbachiella carrageenanivorans]
MIKEHEGSSFASKLGYQKMNKILLTLGLIVSAASMSLAQQGFLRGQVIDGSNGEGLFGATVTKLGTTQGSVADFDGNFSLSLDAGTHDIIIQFVSYQPQTIEGVQVVAGEVTNINVTLSEDVQQLEAVVVTAEQIRDNEVALMSMQRKSANTVDGISSAAFKKVGDSNLSTAMNRVTGVTVQGGKYVYVRGLGDRYTKTSMNGMVIPGLDPDRNDVQIDIFPTAILENVVVYKTFSPNLNGDFAGGLVDIQTKAFPEEKTTSVSLSMGYSPDMHFKSNNVTYDGSATDFLGWDNGQREMPIAKGTEIPTAPNDFVAETTRKFDPTLGVSRERNFMNTGLSVLHRNQIQGDKVTWGYNAILSYKSTNTFYEGYERKRYEKDRTTSEVALVRDFSAVGDLATNSVLWSGLATLAAKTDNHTIGTSLLHTQNGVSTALDREMNFSTLNNPTNISNDILAYTQRTMTNNIIYGKHNFDKLKIEWSNALLFSKVSDPDYRDTRINEDGGNYSFSNGGSMNRFWRELNEVSESFKMDLTYNLNDNNKLKAGGMMTYRNRDFSVYQYAYEPLSVFAVEYNDPNWLLEEDNLYSSTNPNGLYIQDNSNNYNNYEGRQSIFAGYLMNEMQITPKLKSIYGVRMENVQMYYSGVRLNEDNSSEVLDDERTLNETNLLPSVGLVYALRDDMNLRGSFNKTLARPSFKEKSSAFIEDPITRTRFSGNLDIKQAEILNYDLRWEFFFTASEMVSVSFFYKDFTDHIALVFFPNSPGQLKPRNVGEASVYGTEFEVRKNLGMISPVLENLSIGGNMSFVVSKVNRKTVIVAEDGQSEYDSEVAYTGSSDGVSQYREMSGQSPYVVNGYMNYDNNPLGISANLSYNVQGETITFIGTSNVPDVYTKPFQSLNFKLSKDFGELAKSQISFSAKNLLNQEREQVYKFGNKEQIFSLYKPGRLFQLKYTYTF